MRAPAPDPDQILADLLAARGYRITAPRRHVLEALLASDAPLSAAEIHRRLGDRRINLASVYRTVRLFLRLRILSVTDSTNGGQRFELADPFTGHHHHLICRECGKIEDLDGCLLEGKLLSALKRRVRQSRRFRIADHELRLIGACGDCYSQ
jgi:Fur family ferric uptake transcriptional regulator